MIELRNAQINFLPASIFFPFLYYLRKNRIKKHFSHPFDLRKIQMMTVRDKSYGSVVWNKQTCQDMRNLTWFYQYHVCNTKTAASYTTANEGYHYISNLICFSKKTTEESKERVCMCISIVICITYFSEQNQEHC